jgi:hypothetical protein
VLEIIEKLEKLGKLRDLTKKKLEKSGKAGKTQGFFAKTTYRRLEKLEDPDVYCCVDGFPRLRKCFYYMTGGLGSSQRLPEVPRGYPGAPRGCKCFPEAPRGSPKLPGLLEIPRGCQRHPDLHYSYNAHQCT